MNNNRRKVLDEAIRDLKSISERLEHIRANIDDVRDQEEESFSNLPETMAESERAQKMEEAISQLEDANNQLELIDFDEVISCIEIAKE